MLEQKQVGRMNDAKLVKSAKISSCYLFSHIACLSLVERKKKKKRRILL